MLHFACKVLPRPLGPQKKTPASAGAWIFRMHLNTASQFGRPKDVGVLRPEMASTSASAL